MDAIDVVGRVLRICKFANKGRRRLQNDNILSAIIMPLLRNNFYIDARKTPSFGHCHSVTGRSPEPSENRIHNGYSETLLSYPGTASFGKRKEREKDEQAFSNKGQQSTTTAFSTLVISAACTQS